MKYRDLIQFDPVVSVVQLREADDRVKAEQLVRTFVISERMADVIVHRIAPVLDLRPSSLSRGLFIVGNYGTGKSHLMSVLSTVAEYADMLDHLTNPSVAAALQPLAGRFKVIRQEFGATKMPLRDVVLGYIEEGLRQLGVAYHFPPMEEVPNTKDLLVHMMSAFHQKYPDHGLLVAIDELLEYLMHRTERELMLDLAFLREVGEACSLVNLRFMAGIQESLFDNPRFQFAADSIKRVRDRFEQVRIVREDVAYVVSHRLLRKTDAQRRAIREHLERFTPLYEEMAERLDEFVDLFPVHPAYLDMFEQVTILEKRQALREISREMERWLDRDVPQDAPGLISYDSFWRSIQEDPAYRAIPEVREVQDKVRVLEEKVRTTVRETYREPALRIIHALALHRLAVGDLDAPIGLTAKDLRDQLCLLLPLPEWDADFLLTTIEAVLNDILRAVSGQFISLNKENGQYYLDLKKDVDYDALIRQRAETLSEDQLDRYYFEILTHALELTDSTYVPGFRIWKRDIPWLDHGITRDGYVFLGAQTERSTAQPERDFYIHFLGPYQRQTPPVDAPEDEVYFMLAKMDETFDEAARNYAGAREMANVSSSSHQRVYDRKSEEYRRSVINWLQDNFVQAFQVMYQGKTYAIPDLLARYHVSLSQTNTLRDRVYTLTATLLSPVFERRYPNFPRFNASPPLNPETLLQATNAALRVIAGQSLTKQALVILEGLQLVRHQNGELVYTPETSPYARPLLERLADLPPGHVINRKDLIEGAPQRERDVFFHLDAPLFAVILATLVRQGLITVQRQRHTLGADDLAEIARMGVEEFLRFSSIAKPKTLPENVLRAIFAGFNLPEGLIRDPGQHEVAVQTLANTVHQELDRTLSALEALRRGFSYWGAYILSDEEQQAWRAQLDTYKSFLETLERVRTPGNFRTLPLTEAEVKKAFQARKVLDTLDALQKMLDELRPLVEYIRDAEVVLPEDDPWQEERDRLRKEHLEHLRNPNERTQPHLLGMLRGGLENLRRAYAERYMTLHNQARLNTREDARKQQLLTSKEVHYLRQFSKLDFLPSQQFQQWQEKVAALKSCTGTSSKEIEKHVICPYCQFRPRNEDIAIPVAKRLEDVERELDEMFQGWAKAVREELQKPEVEENIKILPSRQRAALERFIQTGELPDTITKEFLEAIQDALRGLELITVDPVDLMKAFSEGGMPCTVDDLEHRFRTFMQKMLHGKQRDKVRIQIEW